MRIKKTVLVLLIIFLAAVTLPAVDRADQDRPAKGELLSAPFASISPERDGNLLSSVLVYEEDFEPLPTNWAMDNGWNIGTSQAFNPISPTNCAFTDNPYADNLNNSLYSPVINLPAATEAGSRIEMSVWMAWNLESTYDFFYIDVWSGGVLQSTILSQTGTQDWTQGNLDLTAFAGMDIQLGFRIMSDGSNGYLGIGIDDLRIEYNVYEESPELNLLSLNSQNFPFIYSTLSVALEGQDMSNLDETNFQVYENDVLQTNFFHVTPPSTGAGSRLVDIAFQMDNSGSMSSSIAAVSANVQNFVNNLAGSGVDSALGLCRYGQSANSGNPILEDNGVLTTNLTYFRDTVWARNRIDGGYEPGYYAITQSLSGFAWRPGSQKVLIIITDETPNQGGSNLQQAIDACTANGAILFALTYSGLFSTFTPITEVTGGAVFDINSSFDAILDAISQIIVSNYIISYRSSNPYYDGVQRNLRFVLNYGNTTAEDFGMYFPGQSPQISRTQTTAAMDTQAQLDNQPIQIDAIITDTYAPFTANATLYYRNFNQNNYTPLPMQNTSGDLWSAQIPAPDVQTPGIAYYFLASDGQSTSTLPSSEPANNPFTVAVLPNLPPNVQHVAQTQTNFYTPLSINATVFDDTDFVDQVMLSYRRYGQLSYTQVPMNNMGQGLFGTVIPGETVGTSGVEYFIRAWDNYGLTGVSGFADSPHYVAALLDGTVIPGGELTDLIWTPANSPYYVTADIFVGPGSTLNILEGCTIIFAPGAGLEIQGGLNATGAIFDAQDPFMGWDGIFINGAQGQILIQNCQVQHAVVGITFINSSGSVIDCNISKDAENNSFTGEAGVVIEGESSPVIDGLNISNYNAGIVIQNTDGANCSPTISHIFIQVPPGQERSAGTGISVMGNVGLNLEEAEIAEYDTGIDFNAAPAMENRNTALLTNIRVRNSSTTSRSINTAMNLTNVGMVQASFLELTGYPTGLKIQSPDLTNASNTELENIQIVGETSEETPRNSDTGIKIGANVALTAQNVIINDYQVGMDLAYAEQSLIRNTALLTNIRVRNSSTTSRTESYGIKAMNLQNLTAEGITIMNCTSGIVLNNSAIPGITNAELNELRIGGLRDDPDRQSDVGLEILGDVQCEIDDLETREFATGIKIVGNSQNRLRTTPLLTNIRVRNSSSSSRTESIGIIARNLAGISLSKCIVFPHLMDTPNQNSLGAAIMSDAVGTMNIDHCTLWGFENGIRLQNSSHANLTRSLIWKNTPDNVELQEPIRLVGSTVNATFCDISTPGGVYPGQGNLDMNPLLANPQSGNFYLKPRSPLHNDDPELLIGALPYDFYALAEEYIHIFPSGWSMTGVPYLLEPGHDSPTQVFGEDLAPFYVSPNLRSILQLNPNSMPDSLGHVVLSTAPSYTLPSVIRPGVGYWVLNNSELRPVSVYGLLDDGPYLMEVPGQNLAREGFYMLSNPYNCPIRWNDGFSWNGVTNAFYLYDPDTNNMELIDLGSNPNGEIPPWSAFIVKANNPGSRVHFHYPSIPQQREIDSTPIGVAEAPLAEANVPKLSWEMSLRADAGEQSSVVILGVGENASDEHDVLDMPSLPFNPLSSLELKVHNPGWSNWAGDYTRDIRSPQDPQQIWDLSLNVEALLVDGAYNGTVRLKMQSPYKLPSQSSFRVIDLASGNCADLLNDELFLQLDLRPGDSSLIPLMVIVDNLPSPQNAPELKFNGTNYPNPFNPSTTISYTLPEDSMVSVDIFNIKGQLVRSLLSDVQQRGSHSVIWNGRDSQDRACASGFYFYRVQAGNHSLTRKILMMK